MTMSDEEKERRRRERAAANLQASLERERKTQTSLRGIDFNEEDQRKISYLNKQLLKITRREDWDFLREVRTNILRHYGRGRA